MRARLVDPMGRAYKLHAGTVLYKAKKGTMTRPDCGG